MIYHLFKNKLIEQIHRTIVHHIKLNLQTRTYKLS